MNNGRLSNGFILGLIIGGGAVFLFGTKTTWMIPVLSLRSIKIILPWSRLTFTQPARVTFWPIFFGVSIISVRSIKINESWITNYESRKNIKAIIHNSWFKIQKLVILKYLSLKPQMLNLYNIFYQIMSFLAKKKGFLELSIFEVFAIPINKAINWL